MSKVKTQIAEVFQPLLKPARYKAAWGGRGSGKSHFFAGLLVELCLLNPGLRVLCIREIQKTLAESSKKTIEDRIQSIGVGRSFRILQDRIEAPGNGFIIFQGMQNHTAESIKSLEGIDIVWIEEAQTLSERSFSLLRPTIRKKGSEIWASWNPTRKADAVDRFFRQGTLPPDAVVVKANWRDNPWFEDTALPAERLLELAKYPERYPHTWEGEYATAFEGSYFASDLSQALADGRITTLAIDPLLPCKAFFDIGVSDATSIWVAQFSGDQIRVFDYIEGVGQPLAYYTAELRSRGWDNVKCYLPHDGLNKNAVTGLRYEDHLRDAGFDVETIPNQGSGATKQRIEALRRLFPRIWFAKDETEAGRDALGFYHEKRDEQRNVGLGPEHDWSSHAADAFGLMAICYENPAKQRRQPLLYPRVGVA